MPSPFIGGRIPQELHDALQKHIEESGEKLPQVLQKALSSYLNYTSAVDKKQSGLEERLTALETAFQKLKADVERSETSDVPPIEETEKEVVQHDQLSILKPDNNPDNSNVTGKGDADFASDIKDEEIDSKSDIIGQELKHEQVAEMVGKSLPAVRADHRRNNSLENNLYRFVPGGIPKHPKWIVERR